MTKSKDSAQEKVVENKNVGVVDETDMRHYTVVIEATFKEGDTLSNRIINVFASNPTEAFSWMLNVRQLYEQEGIVDVKLVGVYKRTSLKVVEGV